MAEGRYNPSQRGPQRGRDDRQLNAKAAYAKGRELVDVNFVDLLAHCLRQAEDARTLGQVKLFLEAFLGFYKAERPREN